MQSIFKKKLGVGSFALVLALLAIVWGSNIQWWDGFCLGDYVLNLLNLPSWSNGTVGTHYTVFYGLIFLIPAIILGTKKREDLFATSGKWIAGVLAFLYLISPFFMIV